MVDSLSIFSRATSNKKGALKHPTARAFSMQEWVEALSSLENPSERDATLTLSAVWFGGQISTVREHTDHILGQLNRRDAVLLAVAQLNREYATLQRRIARARYEESRSDFVDVHRSSQRLIRTSYIGNALPADDLNDALVDTLPLWLYQAFERPEGDLRIDCDFTQLGVSALRAFSLEKSLSQLWQQCLWQDWRLAGDGDRLTLRPNNREAETLRYAWLYRQQSITFQYSFVDIVTEAAAKKANLKTNRRKGRTVIAQEDRAGRQSEFIIGRASSRCASHAQHHMWTGVEDSYVGMFLDAKLPRLGLSCNELQKVWCIITDACDVLSRKCRDSSPVDRTTARDWALACRRQTLSKAISAASGLSTSDTEKALKFLTSDKADFRHGVWSKPLIPLPGQEFLLMCRSPLEIGNAVRRVEQWLERGGLSDQLATANKGASYEAWVRDEIASCLANNPILKDVASISRPIKPADRTIGDIDAALRIKDLIIVLEVKCLLTPYEAIEQHRYRSKLEGASTQASRKATWLADNIKDYLDVFNLHGACPVEIKPVVLVNQGYGLSLEIEGCLVCDFHTLSGYLRDSVVVTGGAYSGLNGAIGYTRETLYRSDEEARHRLLSRIKLAPTLRRYIDRTTWTENLIPCLSPPSNTLAVAGAQLSEDLDPSARIAALSLAK
ncbi:UNVERIFIED_ORG: hypothetical protein BCL66_10899 [Martelella mediterranea]